MDVLERSLAWRQKLALMFNVLPEEASAGELAAFLSFAMAYPNGFLALIDTYEVYRFARFYLFFLVVVDCMYSRPSRGRERYPVDIDGDAVEKRFVICPKNCF